MQSRRRLLEGAAVAALGLAGCPLGGGDGDDEDTPDDETFVDPCASLQLLADASDADGLGTDTTNTENFEHPDGSTDEARIVRHGTTDDVAAVYAPGGELVDATVEFHWHEDVGGDARFEESTDGGGSWADAAPEREEYGGVDNAWRHAELSATFSDGVDRCRVVLTGGDEDWSGQIGHVTITAPGGEPDAADGAGTPAGSPTATSEPTPTGTPIEGSAEDVAFEHFVERDGTEFVVDGQTAYFGGGNHPQVSRLDDGITAEDWLSTWTDLVSDLNVLRVPAFGEGESNYLQPGPGEYNEAAFRLLDRVIYRFGAAGVRLVLPLSNYWEWRGGVPQYVEWSDAAASKDDFYTDEQCQQWFRDFVETVLTRENTITGVEYRDDPTIMLWELMNEPRAGGAGYDVYRDWVRSTAEHVKSIDDSHLVSTGMEGFYGADGPVGHDDSRYVETHAVDAVDACSFHLYPEAWGLTNERGTEWIRNHTADAHEAVGKPAYFGEFGVEVDRTDDVDDAEELRRRNDVYETWYEAVLDSGTNAAMVWDLRTEAEYEWTSGWNRHAVYPRDEGTVDVIDRYTSELTALGDFDS